MFGNLFKTRPEKQAGQAIYDSCVRAARVPGHYQNLLVPDTLEGRLEMVMLHTALVITELNASGGEAGKALSQEVFDAMFDDLDAAMREMGVGDGGVGKKIRFMAEGFYGRARVYADAVNGKGEESLATVLKRNVYGGADSDAAENELSVYVKQSAEMLAGQGFAGLSTDLEARFADLETQS